MQTNIKTSFLSLVSIPILVSATTGSALAASTFKATPYFGADIGMQHFGFKNGYGDNLFKKSLNKHNVFLGVKFNDTFGIEGGYETTTNKTRNTTVYAGESVLGNYMHGGPGGFDYLRYVNKARIFGWHLGITANYPINHNNNMAIIGYVGIKRAKVNLLKIDIAAKDYGDNFETPLNNNNVKLNSDNKKYVVKLAGGIEYFLTKHFGIRALIGWENTGKLKPKCYSTPIRTALLKNSLSYGIGIVVK